MPRSRQYNGSSHPLYLVSSRLYQPACTILLHYYSTTVTIVKIHKTRIYFIDNNIGYFNDILSCAKLHSKAQLKLIWGFSSLNSPNQVAIQCLFCTNFPFCFLTEPQWRDTSWQLHGDFARTKFQTSNKDCRDKDIHLMWLRLLKPHISLSFHFSRTYRLWILSPFLTLQRYLFKNSKKKLELNMSFCNK